MDKEIGLPSFPDKFFDLAVVDPPYGIGEGNKKNQTRGGYAKFGNGSGKKWIKPTNFGGMEFDHKPPDRQYFRELIRVSKNQIVWGANHFISLIPYDSPCWIVWDKANGYCDQADCELAWTSFKSAVRKAKFKWHGLLQQDMKHKERRIHPTQKPILLYRWLLNNYAKPGDLILDTHVGSASSLIACEQMGFNYVGFELDPEYYAAAKNRMAKGIQGVIAF